MMFPKCIMKGLAMFLVQPGVAMATTFARALTLLSFNDICNGVVLLTFCNRNHSIQFHFLKIDARKVYFQCGVWRENRRTIQDASNDIIQVISRVVQVHVWWEGYAVMPPCRTLTRSNKSTKKKNAD